MSEHVSPLLIAGELGENLELEETHVCLLFCLLVSVCFKMQVVVRARCASFNINAVIPQHCSLQYIFIG